MKLIAITGGIGSGKSVVARVVNEMGYHVYDCDSRAKSLMTGDQWVREQLINAFGSETYLDDGSLNRQHLSQVAFNDKNALERLNSIVHPATARDLQQWAATQCSQGATIAFVETALLRTAGLDRVVDQVWHVSAPASVRIERVMARNGMSEKQVRSRINAQAAEDAIADGEQVIVNDGIKALLPQVIALINQSTRTINNQE